MPWKSSFSSWEIKAKKNVNNKDLTTFRDKYEETTSINNHSNSVSGIDRQYVSGKGLWRRVDR